MRNVSKERAPQITNEKRILEFDKISARISDLDKKTNIHLIKIQPNNKIPVPGMSWKKINFSLDYARDVIKSGYNVALVAHNDGLCFIDIDLESGKFKLPEGIIIDLILKFDTLAVKTKSGGIQLYFVNDGITEYFSKNDIARNPKLFYNGADCGEIRTDDAYVLSPGSFVPTSSDDKGSISTATGLYTIFHDAPIRKLSPDQLPDWLTFEQEKKRKNIPKAVPANLKMREIEEAVYGSYINELGMTLEEITERDLKLCELLSGPYGVDGKSRSEGDFSTAIRLDYWRFDDVQKAAIIQQFRPYEKTYRLDYLDMTIGKARSSTKYDADAIQIMNAQITDIERINQDTLPTTLPDRQFILIRAPPRLGKTHWSVLQLISAGSGVYVSHRHEIISHALGIFKALDKKSRAVWLKGKLQCCNREEGMNCDACVKKPVFSVEDGEAGITLASLNTEAEKLLTGLRVLTPEDVPNTLCPYYVTQIAEKYAEFCFTIPFFLKNVDQIRGVKKNRELLVIDEDPTCAEFYPGSTEIASYMHIGRGAIHVENTVIESEKTIDRVEEIIRGKKRKPKVDKYILDIIDSYRKIVSEISNLVDSPSAAKKIEVSTKLKDMDLSNDYTNDEKIAIERKLTEYEKEITKREDTMLNELLAPFIYVAKKPFIWVGKNPSTLHMVSDRVVFYKPTDYKKTIIIGTTEAELYIKDVCGDSYEEKSVIIEINKFPFSENFAILKLIGQSRTEETRMMGSLIHSLGKHNMANQAKCPALILAATKKRQESLLRFLQSSCVISTNHNAREQVSHWLDGKLNIFYTNSIISRGLDLPQYDVIFIDSCSFATPYWSALREYYVENGDTNNAMLCSTIIGKIVMDELTNCAFRHSPIRDTSGVDNGNVDQAKLIIIKRDDFGNLNPQFIDGMLVKDVTGFPDLEFAKVACSKIAKKTNPDLNFELLRDMDLEHLSTVYLLCKFPEKKPSLKGLKGKTKSEMSSFFEIEKCNLLESRKEAPVDPDILKCVTGCPPLIEKKRISESTLVNWIFNRLKQRVHRKTIQNAIELITLSGVLRTEMSDSKTLRRMYRLADLYTSGQTPSGPMCPKKNDVV